MEDLEIGKKYWIKAEFLGRISEPPCGPFIPEERYAFRVGEWKTPTSIYFSVEGFEALEASPEREKVTIPKFVADWIEACKRDGDALAFVLEGDYDIAEWLETEGNEELLARAYLDGYEIEEPLYWVRDKEGKSLLVKKKTAIGISSGSSVDNQKHNIKRYTFTEKEIKDYDERYWAFAVSVEEEDDE